MADNTLKAIKDVIVGDIVLGYKDGKVIPTKVLATYKSPDRHKLFGVSVGPYKVFATSDHKWLSDGTWVETLDLKSVTCIEQSQVQKNMFMGTMLGDSNIDNVGAYRISQSIDHEDYAHFLERVLGLPITSTHYGSSKFLSKEYPTYSFQTMAKVCSVDRQNIYQNVSGRSVKHIPSNISKFFSPEFFATWYMDDGSLSKSNTINPNARLYFHQFSIESMTPIFDYLHEQGFIFSVLQYAPKNDGMCPNQAISFDWKSTIKFCEWIAPFVPKVMGYKLTCEPLGDSLVTEFTVCEKQVDSVKWSNHASEHVYCIQTECENFILDFGAIVHNCKINGQRFILVLMPDGSTHMTSRAKSVKTLRFSELDDHVLGLMNLKSPFPDGATVWDGEIIMKKAEIDLPSGVHTTSTLQSTVALMHLNSKQSLEVQKREGSLTYKVFDILQLNGQNVEKKPYKERAELVVTSVAAMKELNPQCSMEVVPLITDFESAWDEFYKYVHEEGGEGLVLKKLSAPYEQGKRTKNQWKLKGFMTIDCFITGWTPSTPGRGNENYIGGFELSTNYHGKTIPIASIANIDQATRIDATIYDENGKPTLNPKYLNRCLEITCQDLNKKSFRANSARLNAFRDDKNPEDCELLDEQIKFNTAVE